MNSSAPESPKVTLRERVLGTFVHTPESLALLWHCSRSGALAMLLLTLLSAGLPVTVAWLGKMVIDAIMTAHSSPAGSARDAAIHGVVLLVLLELSIVAFQSLLERLSGLAYQVSGARLGNFIQLKILNKALTLELRHFEDHEYYDKLSRARREASSRPLSLITGTLQFVRNLLTLAAYGTILFSFAPWAAVGLLVAAVPPFFAEARFARDNFKLLNRRSPEVRRLGYLEHVMTNDHHVKEVKLFELGTTFLARYQRLAQGFMGEDRNLALRRAGWTSLFSTISIVAFYGCYLAVALAAAGGRITLGEMTFYIVAFRQCQAGIQSMLGSLNRMYEDNLYMANLFEFLALPAANRGYAAGAPSPIRLERGIVFENVSFRYPGSEKWALREFSLAIPPSRSLALVGSNGAGKSTVIKLLTRMYEPTSGRILLDGYNLQDIQEGELSRRIGAIFQDFNRYQLPMGENVGVGSIAHLDDRDKIDRAVDSAGAREIVSSLTHGLDTQLGHWFKDGTELSGGQWQRVALARAFMREEADILILDEPSAALDAEGEHAILTRFRELSRGRTTVIISHRFASVRSADNIVVLDRGRIVEQGTHDELLRADGRYAQLFALQARDYR